MESLTELKDINLGSNTIILQNNRVTSSILPKNTQELSQNISIKGHSILEGAIYTNLLEITAGPVEIKGAVFTNQELHISSDIKESVYFHKAIASTNSVISLLSSTKCVYGADINSPTVKLKNSFVAGSIYGEEVSVENSVVLGGVFSSKTLDINDSIIGTFNSSLVRMGGVNYLLYPTAFSVEPIQTLPKTQLWSLSLADLASLFKKDPPIKNTGKVAIDLIHDTQRTVLTDESGVQTLINSYSISSKVLVADLIDFDKLKNHFIIISASLGEQMLKTYFLQSEKTGDKKELSLKNIVSFFFDILEGKVAVQEISSEVDFNTLKKHFE